jgi:AcrR family transcriptional regulator
MARTGERRRPHAYHHGDLRRALVHTTLRLIAERGPTGFTLREVARRAGVSHNAPYRHFRNKEALLAAVAEEGFVALTQTTERAAREATTPQQRLVERGVAYVTFALDRPSHYRVMFGPAIRRGRHPGLDGAAQRAFDSLVREMASGQQVGAFAGSDPRELARVSWALVHGVADLAIGHQLALKNRKDLDALVTVATTILAKGLERVNLSGTHPAGANSDQRSPQTQHFTR